MPIPTRRLAGLAVLVGVALALYPRPLQANTWALIAAVNALLLAIALFDALLAPGRKHFEVGRQHRPTIEKGTTSTLTWTIANRSRRSVRIRMADELAPSLRAKDDRFGTRIKGGVTATARTELSPVRRVRVVL